MSVRTLVKSIQDIMRKDSGVDGDAQRISQLCWLFFLKIIDDQDQELELMRDGYQSPVPPQFQWRNWAADPEGQTGEALLAFVNDEMFPAMKGLKSTGLPGDRRRVVRDVFEDAYNYMKSGQLLRQVVNKINDVDFNNLSERQHFGDVYEQLLNDLQSAGNAGEYYTPRAVTAFMVDRIDPKLGEIIFDPSCGTGGFLTCAMKHMRDRYVKRPEDEALMQASFRAVEKKPLPHMLCVTNMLLHGVEDPSFVRHDNTLARPYISWEQKDRVDVILTNPPFGGKEEDGIESNFPQHFRTRETADLFLALFIRLLRKGGVAAIVLPDGSLFGEGVKTRLKEALLEECNLHTIVRLPNSVFKPYASIGTNLLFFEKGEPTKDIWFYEHRVPEGQKAYSMTKPIRVEHFAGCVDWWGGAERKGREEGPQAWKVSIHDVVARGFNLDFKNPHSVEADHGNPTELLEQLDVADANTEDLHAQLRGIVAASVASSTASILASQFPRLAVSSVAIARLRRFILDLAVRGKLVDQDPDDEPATDLMKRIQAEKDRLIKQRVIKKSDVLPISDDDAPYPLSAKWAWARLGDIGDWGAGSTPSRGNSDLYGGGVTWLKSGELNDNRALAGSEETVTEEAVRSGSFRLNKPGDVLIAMYGATIGKVAILAEPAVTNQAVCGCSPFTGISNQYLFLFLKAQRAQFHDASEGGAQPNISKVKIVNTAIPVPPTVEQHRIVAKVDELMVLCDQLEDSLTNREQTRSRLLEAILHDALEPA